MAGTASVPFIDLKRIVKRFRNEVLEDWTACLLVALQTLGVKRGMKVALPNLTFWAMSNAV